MLKEILILVLLIAPVEAWEVKNGYVNMTEAELFEFQDMSRAVGIAWQIGQTVNTLRDLQLMQYSDYYDAIDNSNDQIRQYNRMIRSHFNESVCDILCLTEYTA